LSDRSKRASAASACAIPGRIEQAAQAVPQALVRQAAGQHGGHHPLPWRQRRHLRRQEQGTAQPLQAARRQQPGIVVVQQDAAARRPQRAGQDVQQRGLARTRRTDHRDLFARRDFQAHPPQGRGGSGLGGRMPARNRVQRDLHFSRPALRAAASMPL
jgi:hypothetical protein